MFFDNAKTDAGVLLNFLLEVLSELLIAFRRNDGKGVYFKSAQAFTALVNAQS